MVSGDTVYHMTYYASHVYMLQKTGYIYININKNYFKPITFFIVLGGSGKCEELFSLQLPNWEAGQLLIRFCLLFLQHAILFRMGQDATWLETKHTYMFVKFSTHLMIFIVMTVNPAE